MIPVFFIHTDTPSYLMKAIHQAERVGNNVEGMIGNALAERKYEIDEVYMHMTSGNPAYELFCIKRWFMLRDECKIRGIDKLFYCDSDVLLYKNINDYTERFGDKLHLMIPSTACDTRPVASGHCSFWTKELLEAFCWFACKCYTDEELRGKLISHADRRCLLGGGVCDMTLLYFFTQQLNPTDYKSLLVPWVDDLSKSLDCSTFDDNINIGDNYEPNEYATLADKKQIIWKNGVPYAMNMQHYGALVKLNSIHYCGEAKRFIE